MAPKPASPGPAVKAAGKGAQGNILTKKIGPLPGWAWAAIGLGGLYLWKKHQAAAAATSSTTTATPAASLPISDVTAPSGYGYQGPGAGGGSPFGPGWNVGTPTGTGGVNPGGPMIPYTPVVPLSNSGVPNVNYSAPNGISDPAFLTTPATGQVAIGGQNYPVGSTAANNAAIAAGVNPASLYQL